MPLVIRPIKNDAEKKQVLEIRREVFIEGQDVPADLERDDHDTTAVHIIALLGDEPIGCARIRQTESGSKLERIAVLEKYRGSGYGKDIVHHLIQYCQEQRAPKIYMNAQAYLQKFYENLGFHTEGDKFNEAGIEHIKMSI